MIIVKSTRKDKRLEAIFKDGTSIHFGAKNGSTYIDHGDKKKRENYIKRHQVNEDWNTVNAGSLSRFILWGDSNDIGKNILDYKKKFKG
jgi:hypothetical protein